MGTSRDSVYLIVDIGGTKVEVAAFDLADPEYNPLVKQRYQSREFGSIEEILTAFLDRHTIQSSRICLGIAGVVEESGARVTNLPWIIRKKSLYRLGFTAVDLINDMTALASSLVLLKDGDLLCLQEGDGAGGEVCGVLAPGTGLGEGFLLKSDEVFYPKGTEGGHSDFAPVGEEQQRLLRWLESRTRETISYEMVCAGPAIGTLYDFYSAEGVEGSADVLTRIMRADDRTPVIIEAALSGSCPLCTRVLDLFLRILGREGANIVMKLFCTGGLFLGGGILPHLAGRVSFTPFLDAFRKKGTMAELAGKVPVNIILRQDAALLGAACFCRMKDFNKRIPDSRIGQTR